MEPNPIMPPPRSQVCTRLAEHSMEGERCSSSPTGSSLAEPGWFGNEHIRAKRARVETIIRGIGLSNTLVPGSARVKGSACYPEKALGRKGKQRRPVQQVLLQPGPARNQVNRKGGPGMREQLHQLEQQLRRLQGHILQATVPTATAQGLGLLEPRTDPLSGAQRDGYRPHPWVTSGGLSGAEKHRVSEAQPLSEELRSLPSGAQALLEILKKELTRAVSQAVESALQTVLANPPNLLAQHGRTFQGLVPEGGGEPWSSEGGTSEDANVLALLKRGQSHAGVSLESVSLAEPADSPQWYSVSPRSVPRPFQGPMANYPLAVPPHIRKNQILSPRLGLPASSRGSRAPPQALPPQPYPSAEPALRPWLLSLPLAAAPLQSRPLLASVKTEPGGLRAAPDALRFSSAHIQEGLNPGHLKKAKLMFFFARYPSSNLLKAYFPDVQFNRCITSQMIKWFSNFREFYYIQMEKSARQAISDGVTDPKALVLLRDSELFRVLNAHYNKGSGFEVPDCFLEIASVTVQEFFRAVSTGRDSDASWKKPIYKIISKLDSDIPEIFKLPSYPQELFQGEHE
ncbi:prospero homeobox protein 2 [Octodon degus]|uniref:Prospero homeobox protein 2 n=1 Tax=Octodon degus TaxID=10160 RepID=A0A6P6DGW9_OCTDE|nr:prospero homeobox protein 2 [Octodon degus]